MYKDNLTGKIFGKLIVKKELPKKTCYRQWECACIDCGVIINTNSYNLIKGLSKSCGIRGCRGNNRDMNLIGKEYGKLTVEKRIYKTNSLAKQKIWLCKCDCGRYREVRTHHLNKGIVTHCGCENVKYKDRTIPAKNEIFKHYKNSAKKRYLTFSLNFDYFVSLANSDCCYCGSSPSNRRVSNKGFRNLSIWLYNGIDRVNNSIGYTKENCVPCCFSCNNAKHDSKIGEFIEWGIKLKNNLKEKYGK